MPSLRFLGHSACEITAGETSLLIDPFLTGNPLAGAEVESLHPTAILVTHAHNDHLGDTVSIARRTGAQVVSVHEIAVWLEQQGVSAHGMSLGGAFNFSWGWVKMTLAFHSSSYEDGSGAQIALGNPGGFLVKVDGKTLYHAGDTALFGDMSLIGRAGIDVALIPIGDNYTMGPDDALDAVKLLQPRLVVPIHYNTFPPIRQDAHLWAHRVRQETSAQCTVLEPGESLTY